MRKYDLPWNQDIQIQNWNSQINDVGCITINVTAGQQYGKYIQLHPNVMNYKKSLYSSAYVNALIKTWYPEYGYDLM